MIFSFIEKLEQKEKVVGFKLTENATLLATLAKEQKDRLSKPLPQNLTNVPGPSQTEVKLGVYYILKIIVELLLICFV